tara:strand:- start:2399 stop:4066 length:1668 start_codon:yes stop_codon:yes gene_type:complete
MPVIKKLALLPLFFVSISTFSQEFVDPPDGGPIFAPCEPGQDYCVCYDEGFCQIEPPSKYESPVKQVAKRKYPNLPFLSPSFNSGNLEDEEGEGTPQGRLMLRHSEGELAYEEVIDCEIERANYNKFLVDDLGVTDGGDLASTLALNEGMHLEIGYIPRWGFSNDLQNSDVPSLTDKCTPVRLKVSGYGHYENFGISDFYFLEPMEEYPTGVDLINGYQRMELDLSVFDEAKRIGDKFAVAFYHSTSRVDTLNKVTGLIGSKPLDVTVIGSEFNYVHVLENFSGPAGVVDIEMGRGGTQYNDTPTFRGLNKVSNINELSLTLPFSRAKVDNSLKSLERVGSLTLYDLSGTDDHIGIPDSLHNITITDNLTLMGFGTYGGSTLDLSAFDGLSYLNGDLRLERFSLPFSGLNNLQSVENLIFHSFRTEMNGLRSLREIRKDVKIESTYFTNLDFMANITSLHNEVLHRSGGHWQQGVFIGWNNNLTDIRGLSNISYTKSPIYIQNRSYTNKPQMSSPFCQAIMTGDVKIVDPTNMSTSNVYDPPAYSPTDAVSYICN